MLPAPTAQPRTSQPITPVTLHPTPSAGHSPTNDSAQPGCRRNPRYPSRRPPATEGGGAVHGGARAADAGVSGRVRPNLPSRTPSKRGTTSPLTPDLGRPAEEPPAWCRGAPLTRP
jgi:hypothetical protein